jgi:hypothetical protein
MLKKNIATYLILLITVFANAQSFKVSFGFLYGVKKTNQKYITILEIITRGEAEKAKLKSGDEIYTINGDSLGGKTNDDISKLIADAKIETKISLGIKGYDRDIIVRTSILSQYFLLEKSDKKNFAKVADLFNFYIYEGEYNNENFEGNYNGKGKLNFFGEYKGYEGSKIIEQEGIFKDGKFVSGTTFYNNGDDFIGTLKNGLPYGEGTYIINKTKYIGNYNENGK